ncbi:unnamed protein product [Litomosoides sigmodontis]|uniref:Lipid-binding serum glycoprotein N-terminal domain-containing protein n=1 Tax=Litomosoides sigmodontis TaxID=42156 RepID=A0A3P6SIN1_LITSI|nr:unnamed protein product [Litomosoides sigmodontis]
MEKSSRMRAHFSLIIQFVVFVSCTDGETTLRVRFNKKTFVFAASIIEEVLQNEVGLLAIPSQKVSAGSGSATIKEMRVESFENPLISISPIAPDGLGLSVSSGSLAISGSWDASYVFLWTMYFSGDLSLKMAGIKTFTRINLLSEGGKLQLNLKECQLKIGKVNLKLYGGISAWIANYFTGGIEKDIRKSLQKKICGHLKDNTVEVNKKLRSLRSQINIIDNVYLSHQLLKNPKVTESSIQFDFSAYATFGPSKCYLRSKGISESIGKRQIVSNHMVTLWLDESMINCYPKTWYETINDHLYIENSKQFHDFYYLNCKKTNSCAEKFHDSNISDKDQLVDVDIYLIKAPILHAENGIHTETSVKTVFHQLSKNSSKSKLKELTIHARSLLNTTISQRRINVRTEKLTVTTSEEDNWKFDNSITMESLKYVAEHALKELKLWEYFLNLPKLVLPRLTLSNNAAFTGMDKFIRADVDFVLSDQ